MMYDEEHIYKYLGFIMKTKTALFALHPQELTVLNDILNLAASTLIISRNGPKLFLRNLYCCSVFISEKPSG